MVDGLTAELYLWTGGLASSVECLGGPDDPLAGGEASRANLVDDATEVGTAAQSALSPFGVLEDLRVCLIDGDCFKADLGGSTAVLDRILENDIGSVVLVGFDSSKPREWLGLCDLSCIPSDDIGCSEEPLTIAAVVNVGKFCCMWGDAAVV